MSNLQHFAKTPATRIDSMEVYESPFQSRMSGKLFQSGLRFDDYEKICWVLGRASDPRKCDFLTLRKRTSFQMKFNLPEIYDITSEIIDGMNARRKK